MCQARELALLCEGCGNITFTPSRRWRCSASWKSGRLNQACRYFKQVVDLVLVSPESAKTECYYCYVERAPPAEANRDSWHKLHRYIRRRLLTQTGWSGARIRRRPNDPYGPLYMNISRRISSSVR